MENMKMSECFSMPIRGEYERDYCDEYHYSIYDNSGDLLLPCLPEDVNHEAIVFATNNHDRLVEENAELREFAKYCQGFLGCEETRDSMALHGITIKAKELLNK